MRKLTDVYACNFRYRNKHGQTGTLIRYLEEMNFARPGDSDAVCDLSNKTSLNLYSAAERETPESAIRYKFLIPNA